MVSECVTQEGIAHTQEDSHTFRRNGTHLSLYVQSYKVQQKTQSLQLTVA